MATGFGWKNAGGEQWPHHAERFRRWRWLARRSSGSVCFRFSSTGSTRHPASLLNRRSLSRNSPAALCSRTSGCRRAAPNLEIGSTVDTYAADDVQFRLHQDTAGSCFIVILGIPGAVLIISVEFWERFSFYGMLDPGAVLDREAVTAGSAAVRRGAGAARRLLERDVVSPSAATSQIAYSDGAVP
jgi:hypothetical protein